MSGDGVLRQIVPFDRITDNRNNDPLILRSSEPRTAAWATVLSASIDIEMPDLDDITPSVVLNGHIANRQPYALAIFGEKSSLEDVLLPIAESYGADLYLGAGEMSDTHIHRMAKDAVADGRMLIVFTCTDCDPSGYQMTTSIGRKLQGLRDLRFPSLQFEVRPAALTVEQVKERDLPSTPLKTTEKRADKWRESYGVQQTEIDALATLDPDALREIVTEAIDPFFDSTLADREMEARQSWQEAADAALEEEIDGEALAEIREKAASVIESFEAEIDALNEDLAGLIEGKISLPKVPKIEPEIDDTPSGALISSDMSWVEATRALKARKSYGDEP